MTRPTQRETELFDALRKLRDAVAMTRWHEDQLTERLAAADALLLREYAHVEQVDPNDYVCSVCGASRVKLWRVAACSHIELFCARCGLKEAKMPAETVIDAEGYHESEYGQSDQFYANGGVNLVPAVPSDGGYWGYTSVPSDGVAWWRGLPTYPKQKP